MKRNFIKESQELEKLALVVTEDAEGFAAFVKGTAKLAGGTAKLAGKVALKAGKELGHFVTDDNFRGKRSEDGEAEQTTLTTAFQEFAERVSSVEQGYTKYDVTELRIELLKLDDRLATLGGEPEL